MSFKYRIFASKLENIKLKIMLNIDLTETNEKNEIIDRCIKQLKQEFIGIDEQIDAVMDNIRTWYLYPQLQTRPVVVSLYGMTGIGKTSLIRRISELLDIEKDLVYFNFAEINEMQAYEVENEIETNLSNENESRLFVYDEFQFASTLDEDGKERDNKSALKPFWELMDSGILHKRASWGSQQNIRKVIAYLERVNEINEIKLENGVWVNKEECVSEIPEIDLKYIGRYLNLTIEETDKDETGGRIKRYQRYGIDYEYIIDQEYLDTIFYLYNRRHPNEFFDFPDFMELMYSFSYDELITFLTELLKDTSKGYDLNFSKSIIFVIANLDEAYSVSFNTNPDMSPDQFHTITKKISIVDIKNALQRRFRNEQIARLGNICISYPSFSSSSFKGIIKLHLKEYQETVQKSLNIKLTYERSLYDCIYKESVFPTHGTRPIFSTIYEIVKSRFPEIIRHAHKNNVVEKIHEFVYSVKNKKLNVVIKDINGNELTSTKFSIRYRVEKLRDTTRDDRQAVTAVHESGHFVVYTALTGKIPEKVMSKSSEKNIGGFMMSKIEEDMKTLTSCKNIFNDICVAFGGYVAELLVFGKDNITNGACEDFVHITRMATKCMREWGFGNYPFISSYMTDHPDGRLRGHQLIKIADVDEEVEKLIMAAFERTKEILLTDEWNDLFKKSSKYLLSNSVLTDKKMEEFYAEVPESVHCSQKVGDYVKIVENL